jgi:uncharacterized protein DUF4145
MTFDVTAQAFRHQRHGWVNTQEVFSVCRECHRPTTFIIEMSLRGRERNVALSERFSAEPHAILSYEASLNDFYEVGGYVSLRDQVTVRPPEHLPENIEAAFKEGAACHSIGCYNAAACMFRLCLDLVSRPLLPREDDASAAAQPTNFQRRNLGPRLTWLFDQNLLPRELRELANSVRDDGNDGAHAGSLSKEDAEDLLDFTVAFLERLITEPERLRLADARRQARRGGS